MTLIISSARKWVRKMKKDIDFLKRIEYPRLSVEESEKLIRELNRSEKPAESEIYEKVTTGNLYRVPSIIKNKKDSAVPYPELLQTGNMALFEFFAQTPIELSSWTEDLEKTVKKAIDEVLSEEDRISAGQDSVVNRLNEMEAVCQLIREKEKRAPEPSEVARALGISVSDVEKLTQIVFRAYEAEKAKNEWTKTWNEDQTENRE